MGQVSIQLRQASISFYMAYVCMCMYSRYISLSHTAVIILGLPLQAQATPNPLYLLPVGVNIADPTSCETHTLTHTNAHTYTNTHTYVRTHTLTLC